MNLPAPRSIRLQLLGLLGLFLAIPAPPAHAQSAQASRSSQSAPTDRAELISRLDSLAGAPVEEGRAVGISAAVVHGNDTLLLRGYGDADIELDVPTPENAVYEIGSVTKQFTAAAILKLRDEGKLDLDADVTEYLPDYPTAGYDLPLRRLLDHTSGIKGMTEIEAFREMRVRRLPRDSAVAMFAAEPFQFAPGEAMVYNNSAYFLLGLIIEEVSGMPYEDYVEQELFAPLGMENSLYCSNTEVVEGRAHGYQWDDDGFRRADYIDHTWPYSGGSLCSTAGDLVTWLHALHGGEALPEESYREMTTPARLNDGTELRYGMGLSLGTGPLGQPVIGHGGGIPGFVTDTRWYPEEELAVVVLMNSMGPVSPSALAVELAAEIIEPVRPELREFTGDPDPLLGTYSGPARGPDMTIEVTKTEDGGIAGSVNGSEQRTPAWVEDWTFREGNMILTFEREGESGPADILRVDAGGGHYVLRRTDP